MLATITFALGLLGHVLSYAVSKKRRGLYWTLVVIWAVIFAAVFWGEQSDSSEQIRVATSRHSSLSAQHVTLERSFDSLKLVFKSSESKIDSQSVVIQNLKRADDSLVAVLSPFLEMAHVYTPSIDDGTALVALANQMGKIMKGVAALQSTLQFRPEKTAQLLDKKSGLYTTRYVFRPQGGVLRDIAIEVRFKQAFASASGDVKGGAIKLSSGIRMTIQKDNKGFRFTANELIPSNDIIIDVVSQAPPIIVNLQTSP